MGHHFESGGDNLAAAFSPELVDLWIYVIDVAQGDKIPRKGGPGITRSDLLVINKIDLAVGATAHSFGLESLVQFKLLTTAQLAEFLADYLTEMGALESYFCRAGQRLARIAAAAQFDVEWLAVNERLSALKPARGNRAASALLGRHLLLLPSSLEAGAYVPRALNTSLQAGAEAHYCLALT